MPPGRAAGSDYGLEAVGSWSEGLGAGSAVCAGVWRGLGRRTLRRSPAALNFPKIQPLWIGRCPGRNAWSTAAKAHWEAARRA